MTRLSKVVLLYNGHVTPISVETPHSRALVPWNLGMCGAWIDSLNFCTTDGPDNTSQSTLVKYCNISC